jgi:hypothetical protein
MPSSLAVILTQSEKNVASVGEDIAENNRGPRLGVAFSDLALHDHPQETAI